ncbi:hypothetical protein F5879DRAFT_9398 [Lentinula edodes]|nr:hypothetical protein HHX47_DHR5000222 [Lentinula edodes]KAJ3909643.1 hypothetical protein F5879DRAFT_9398 [Lentinula edodes]KAJ3912566.1 hypothetical protein F5877DRAFT_84678 [Lentinula edodes]
MSPAHSEFMPSSTAYPTNDHIIRHTHPSLNSIWTIIALTFVVVVVSCVVCYSIYSCYHSAVYQQQLEIAESIRQRARAESRSRKGLSANGQLNDMHLKKHVCLEETAKLSALHTDYNGSVTSFQSSTMPDITSPALAVTYSTQTPFMHHASPIFPLPGTDYESVKLSPGSSTPILFDSNNIPFYMPGSPLMNPKLAPAGGAFDHHPSMPPPTEEVLTSGHEACINVTAVSSRPRSASGHFSRLCTPVSPTAVACGNTDLSRAC